MAEILRPPMLVILRGEVGKTTLVKGIARAVEAAVYLHGLAADFAVQKMDEHTVLATDTLGCLSDAFRYRVKDEDGLTWVCGLRGRPTTDLSGWHG